jgi:hypothetical protein
MKKFRNITHIWPTADKMDEELLINLTNNSITRKNTNHTYIPQVSGNCKYPAINFSKNGKLTRILIHTILFYHKHRYLPEEIDHIDFNTANYDVNNLRPLTRGENSRYRKKVKSLLGKIASSKHKGVHKVKSKGFKLWRARIVIPKNHLKYKNEKSLRKNLGYFKTEDDAGQAYNDAVRKYGLEDVSVLNDTPQERARTSSLFDNLEPITNLK